jgi:hypothetical protein
LSEEDDVENVDPVVGVTIVADGLVVSPVLVDLVTASESVA